MGIGTCGDRSPIELFLETKCVRKTNRDTVLIEEDTPAPDTN